MKKGHSKKRKQGVSNPSLLGQFWNFIKQGFSSLWSSFQKAVSRLAKIGQTRQSSVVELSKKQALLSEQKDPRPSPKQRIVTPLEDAKKAAEQEGKHARRLTHSLYSYLDPGWKQLGLAISRAEYIMQKECTLTEVEEIRQTLRNKMTGFKILVAKKHLIKQKAEVSLAQFKKLTLKSPNQEIAQDVLLCKKKIESTMDIKNYPKIESDSVLKELEGVIQKFSGMVDRIMSDRDLSSSRPSKS